MSTRSHFFHKLPTAWRSYQVVTIAAGNAPSAANPAHAQADLISTGSLCAIAVTSV
ncbi:hypothetical protein ACH347_06065 [Saccharopolyspora sp. 5N102]|uniref:hypothetical protein n=1 Tax=Saccharopolyspora sp. 5N102 TaxID=3375155 RepID=UPI0037994B24